MYLLFYVTSNGISVIFVTVQMSRRTEEEKTCYDKAGNLPNKGRNFNTQTRGKNCIFLICMISRYWFQTKFLPCIA